MSDLPQSLTASKPEQARLLLDPALLTPLGHLMRGEVSAAELARAVPRALWAGHADQPEPEAPPRTRGTRGGAGQGGFSGG